MYRFSRLVPVRVSIFVLVLVAVLVRGPVTESVILALIALAGAVIAGDTARPSGFASGPDPRPLAPAVAEQLQRVKAALARPAPAITPGSGVSATDRPVPPKTPGSGAPPPLELIRRRPGPATDPEPQ